MIKCQLPRLLGERRMHISDLQKMTGITYATLWNLYHEKTSSVSFKVTDKICGALGITPGELFEYVPGEGE